MNLQREDLNPFEEAAGIARLQELKGYKQRKIGRIIGRSEVVISNLFKINRMPDEVKQKLSSTKVSRDHLFIIADQVDPEAMLKLHDKILKLGLTVPQTREVVQGEDQPKKHALIAKTERLDKDLNKAIGSDTLGGIEPEEARQLMNQLVELSETVGKVIRKLADKKNTPDT